MDNITHSLAGLLLAGTAVALRARQVRDAENDHRFAHVAALTGVIGANLPDIDVVWSAALQGAGVYDDLLSLLHHRGYTHTVLAAVFFIPMLWWLAAWYRQRQQRDTIITARERRADSKILFGLSAVAILSHVTLDSTNDYGVHPFSPFVNRWAYGDSVFIIEPWLWMVAIPMVLRVTSRRLTRGVLWTLLLIGLALSWVAPQVSTVAAAVVTVGAALWILLSRRVSPRRAAGTGLAAWIAVTSCFAIGMSTVRQNVRRQVGAEHARLVSSPGAAGGNARLIDVMTSPSPANPLCARVIAIETTRDEYRLTTAWASAVPALVTAKGCSAAAHTDTTRGAQTLPMERSARPDTRSLDWQWTWRAPRAELAKLERENCRVSAWLRFVRAPFWIMTADDSLWVGDLRYDRERVSVAAYTFATRPATCPRFVPPWTRPREGVLSMDAAD